MAFRQLLAFLVGFLLVAGLLASESESQAQDEEVLPRGQRRIGYRIPNLAYLRDRNAAVSYWVKLQQQRYARSHDWLSGSQWKK